MSETQEKNLPYIDRLDHQRRELGNISSGDIYYLLRNIPPTESPSFLNLNLKAPRGAIPGTTGVVRYYPDGQVRVDVKFSKSLDKLLKGGKVEELDIDFPKYEDGRKGLFEVPKAIESLRGVLGTLQQESYEILLPDFKLGQYAVETRTPSAHAKMFARAIDAELRFETKPLVEGESPRKLVFSYTQGAMKKPEFEAWTKVLDKIKKSKVIPSDDR